MHLSYLQLNSPRSLAARPRSCTANFLPPPLFFPQKKRSRAPSTSSSTAAGSSCPTRSTFRSTLAPHPAACSCKSLPRFSPCSTRHVARMYLESHAADIRVVHFLGVKPWACTRLRDCNTHNANYAHTQQMWALELSRHLFCFRRALQARDMVAGVRRHVRGRSCGVRGATWQLCCEVRVVMHGRRCLWPYIAAALSGLKLFLNA